MFYMLNYATALETEFFPNLLSSEVLLFMVLQLILVAKNMDYSFFKRLLTGKDMENLKTM